MLTVRRGEESDSKAIEQFIKRSDALYEEDSLFIVVEDERNEIVGVVGIVMIENVGWLRSFVFSPNFPSERLPIFLERILVIAKEQSCSNVYLATNQPSSIPLFQTFGFSVRSLEEIPENLKLSTAVLPLLQKKDVVYMWKTLV
ncbi:GNAT family N-acetyltransferase [Bacillus massiliigorillae]|uniref:GNAT family N-acetyltransferase n=1 Tax=Bacillus massiliigorillae TaxID=1243664 RepID=UPI0003A9D002|nr:GNAT family N-acetyltransferase [Bacillus massiliigorillae]